MKKSNLMTLVVFLVLIPLTLVLGSKIPGRMYYITGTLIIVELMIPFFMAFEGRKPQARELVLVAVMCALAIAGRVVIPLPHFKAAFALIMLAGIAFGPETGFIVGAWQMFAYGAGGMLAGFCFRTGWLPRKPWVMAIFGFLANIIWIGPLLDCSSLFLMLSRITWSAMVTIFTAGLYVNVMQGLGTAVVLFFLGRPMLEKLDRMKVKYGLMEL